MSAERGASERGTGRATRLGIAATVSLNLALAAGAAGGLTWLAARPGLRSRIDLTAGGENTLDANSREVLDGVQGEEPILVDVFLRPLPAPLDQISARAQQRLAGLLRLAWEQRPELVRLTHHALAGPTGAGETEARMRELGITEIGVVVVSRGDRKEIVRFLGDVAEIDIGRPANMPGGYVPPRLLAFRGEEAIVKAVLKVTQGERPHAYFSSGHGERNLYGEDPRDLGLLEAALRQDGFIVKRWVSEEQGAVPDDCAVLALIAPQEPLSPRERDFVREFVDRGGSLIAVPGHRRIAGEGSVSELLEGYGVRVGEGVVSRPYVGAGGSPVYGIPECAEVVVRAEGMAARHPITASLRRAERRVRIVFSRPLERGRKPTGGVLLDLLSASEFTWADLPDEDGVHRWEWDEESEREGPFSLALTSRFPPPLPGPAPPPGTMEERPESRVLGLGAPDLFANVLFDTNRDFLLNAFNWAASREYRVSISPRDPDLRRLELGSGSGLFVLTMAAVVVLPLSCLLLGLGVAFKRRR
ncbi:MAG: GldG family protein [Planctomycetota bacterium]|nr:GldG family protein [Planctomycetota bacterium]